MALAGVAVLAGGGCGSGGGGGDGSGGADAAGDDQAIRVGVIHPISDALAPYGRASLNGIRMKVNEINAAGGIGGRKIELYVEDNKGNTTASLNALTKLVGSNRVVAVVAPLTSTNALAIRTKLMELKVPAISPTATNDRVTVENDYMFRACFNDSFQGRIIASYAARELKISKAAIMKDNNSDYSKGLSRNFKTVFEELGGTVVAEEGYQQGDTDFGTQLKKAKGSGAELLFVPGYPPEVPLIIKQAKALGLPARLCGADGWDNDAVLTGSGDHIVGSFLVGAFSRQDTRPVVQDFVRNYFALYGNPPDTFSASGYDAMGLLAQALGTASSPAGIRDGLAAIRDFDGVTGKISMTPGGDPVKPAVILEVVRDGETFTARYKATVSP
jgi:branched-chain amino acid transport system substrate-binding protein